MAPTVVLTINKESAGSKVGVRLKDKKSGEVSVQDVDPNGPVKGLIEKGDIVVSINGVKCDQGLAATAMLKQAQGPVTLVVKPHSGIFSKVGSARRALKAQGSANINIAPPVDDTSVPPTPSESSTPVEGNVEPTARQPTEPADQVPRQPAGSVEELVAPLASDTAGLSLASQTPELMVTQTPTGSAEGVHLSTPLAAAALAASAAPPVLAADTQTPMAQVPEVPTPAAEMPAAAVLVASIPRPAPPAPTPEPPAPTPEETVPMPKEPAPTLEVLAPTPEAPTPTHEALALTPEEPAPMPEAPAVTPAAPAVTPAAPAVTPAAPAETPAAPAETPAAPAEMPAAPTPAPVAPTLVVSPPETPAPMAPAPELPTLEASPLPVAPILIPLVDEQKQSAAPEVGAEVAALPEMAAHSEMAAGSEVAAESEVAADSEVAGAPEPLVGTSSLDSGEYTVVLRRNKTAPLGMRLVQKRYDELPVIADIDKEGPAALTAIRVNDILMEVNGTDARATHEELKAALGSTQHAVLKVSVSLVSPGCRKPLPVVPLVHSAAAHDATYVGAATAAWPLCTLAGQRTHLVSLVVVRQLYRYNPGIAAPPVVPPLLPAPSQAPSTKLKTNTSTGLFSSCCMQREMPTP